MKNQLLDLMEKAKVSKATLAKMVNVNPRTVRRWTSGETRVPTAVMMFMLMVIDKESKVDHA